jgi:hypothetical protein
MINLNGFRFCDLRAYEYFQGSTILYFDWGSHEILGNYVEFLDEFYEVSGVADEVDVSDFFMDKFLDGRLKRGLEVPRRVFEVEGWRYRGEVAYFDGDWDELYEVWKYGV